MNKIINIITFISAILLTQSCYDQEQINKLQKEIDGIKKEQEEGKKNSKKGLKKHRNNEEERELFEGDTSEEGDDSREEDYKLPSSVKINKFSNNDFNLKGFNANEPVSIYSMKLDNLNSNKPMNVQ